MKAITLGASKITCSRLTYGCWRIAGTWEPAEVTSDRFDHGRAAVIAAYEAGFTLFDNADIYCQGVTEKIFGQVLREVKGMRDRIVVMTKCGIRRRGDPDPMAPYRYDFSAEHILKSCDESLQRMGIDIIDVYLLHRPDYLSAPEEVAGAFERLKQQGKVREFGVSNFLPSQFALLQKFCPMRLIVNQVQISLASLQAFEDGTLDHCMSEGVTPMAWAPLAQGLLASLAPVDLRDHDHAQKIQLRETIQAIARSRSVSTQVIALAWLLKHPARIVPVVGSIRPERIRDAVQADDIELTREEWYRLMEAAKGNRLP